MKYTEAVDYLDSLINYENTAKYDYGTSFKLDRMKRFAGLMGDPQANVPSAHIAGSKGKGSTASFLAGILKEAGLSTGIFTSPHLLSVRERIRINDGAISEEAFTAIIERIVPVAKKLELEHGERPTYFEACTMAAFLYFDDQRADCMVLETGLGGRLDSTNIVTPLVSVITSISYEHTDKLGRTLGSIAFEKAGIIKPGVPVICAAQDIAAMKVIDGAAAKNNSTLTRIGREIGFNVTSAGMDGQSFDIKGPSWKYEDLSITLLGGHQVENASLAVAAAEILKSEWGSIDEGAVRRGVSGTRWPGRLDVVKRNPLIVLDGAHNKASADRLRVAVKSVFEYNRLHVILGVMAEKDLAGICEELSPAADKVYVTRSGSPRAADPAILESLFKGLGKEDVFVARDVTHALDAAEIDASPDDMILVTGSLYVVGEAIRYLSGADKPENGKPEPR